jgi:hypothetical protein
VAARIEAELLVDLDDKQISALQDALAKIWQRAEAHELHPVSIRAKAERFVRERLATTQRRGARAEAATTRERNR